MEPEDCVSQKWQWCGDKNTKHIHLFYNDAKEKAGRGKKEETYCISILWDEKCRDFWEICSNFWRNTSFSESINTTFSGTISTTVMCWCKLLWYNLHQHITGTSPHSGGSMLMLKYYIYIYSPFSYVRLSMAYNKARLFHCIKNDKNNEKWGGGGVCT